jgi:hypothetical protein
MCSVTWDAQYGHLQTQAHGVAEALAYTQRYLDRQATWDF